METVDAQDGQSLIFSIPEISLSIIRSTRGKCFRLRIPALAPQAF